ncbi:MAG: hypothetical protein IPN94_14910 [Sphingobacteriales bacterium]|nr:hypothetical protein [Sphingobacteriales bacterium]
MAVGSANFGQDTHSILASGRANLVAYAAYFTFKPVIGNNRVVTEALRPRGLVAVNIGGSAL